MRTLAIAAVLAVSAATSATAHAGSGLIIPPVELDYGFDHLIGGGGAVTGTTTDMLAGIHWASLAWYPTSFDVGVGFVDSDRELMTTPSARSLDASTSATNHLDLKGGYLSFARTFHPARHPHWRTWLSARGELLHGSMNDGRTLAALGGALRVQSEVYVHGAMGAQGGGFIGTLAIGVYVEASHRDLAPELGPDSITSGIAIRLPFIVAGS